MLSLISLICSNVINLCANINSSSRLQSSIREFYLLLRFCIWARTLMTNYNVDTVYATDFGFHY